jgi:translocation and assembly module TamB
MIDTPNFNHRLKAISSIDSDDTTEKPKSYPKILSWIVYLILLSLGGGLSYSWYLLTQKLSPLVETELTKFLHRPIELGKVETISLTGVRFGKSQIPSTTNDSDYVSVEGVDVTFNPIRVITEQKLQLDLTLIRPDIHIEEDDTQTWINTKLNRRVSQWNGISIGLQSLTLQDSSVTLKPKLEGDFQGDIKLKVSQSTVSFTPNLMSFDLQGNFINGGKIDLQGFYKSSERKLNLLVDSQGILAQEVDYLLPLPFHFTSGTVNTNLRVNLHQGKLETINGYGNLNQVDLTIPKLTQPFTQAQGKVIFKDRLLNFENVSTNYGLIPTKVNGVISTDGKIDLKVTTKSLPVNKVISTLNLPQPSVPIQGDIKGDLQIRGTVKKPELRGNVTTTKKSKLDRIDLNQAQGNFTLINSYLTIQDLKLTPTWGGVITGDGNISLHHNQPKYFFNLSTTQIPGNKVADIYDLNLPLEIGKVSGYYTLAGSWKQLDSFNLNGTTKFNLAEGEATLSNLNYNQHSWQANLNVSNLNLSKFPNLNCSKLKCDNSRLSGDFTLSSHQQQVTLNTTNIKGNARFNYLGGEVSLKNLQLKEGNWDTLVETSNIEIAQIPQLSAQSLPSLTGKINSQLRVRGNLDNQSGMIVTGNSELTLPEGKITLANLHLEDSKFLTDLIPHSLQLNSFNPQLRGTTTGKLKISGNLDQLSLDQLNISGNLNFSNGMGSWSQPLTTTFNWDGEKLLINKVVTKGIEGKGIVNVNLSTQEIENFNLDVKTDNIDLKTLPLSLPSQLESISYHGAFNFNGKIFGTLAQPNFKGNLGLNNFALSAFQFQPLSGEISINPSEGVKLQLSENKGKGDFLTLSLDSNYQPNSVNLQVGEMRIEGLRNNQTFSLSTNNIPLRKLAQSLPTSTPLNLNELDGNLAGNIDINLENYNFYSPDFTLTNFKLGKFEEDTITASLERKDNEIAFKKGYFESKLANFSFDAKLLGDMNNLQITANIQVGETDVQEILKAGEFYEWEDFQRGLTSPGQAKDLYTYNDTKNTDSDSPQPLISVGDGNIPILDQLAYIQEIEKKVEQIQQENRAKPLPKLEELNGKFAGMISLTGTLKEGVKTEFSFQGDNWNWGKYQANLVQVKGSYQDGLLTLLPIQIKQDESLFSLTGTFTKERLSGQIRVENLPVSQIEQVVSIPDRFDLGGNLNANVVISGSEENPLAKGEVVINSGTINGTAIDSSLASFSYNNSRLNFFATSTFKEKTDPLTVKGSFPYQLFSNSVLPDNDQFNVSLNFSDKGFSFFNLISNNSINWLEGNGNINLDILGNYNQAKHQIYNLNTEGIISLENGVIASNLLPDKPLTDINGKVLFDFDQIKVDNLTGNFSGGDITISGNLPLVEPIPQVNPLTIQANNLALNFKELYTGSVQGNVAIIGSALSPKIGGNIELYDGKISLPDNSQNDQEIGEPQISLNLPKFQDFNLKLGPNVQITKQPILNLTAMGNLKVNGTINQPNLNGNINLQHGSINLFTSQLKLAENYNNVVKFNPDNGFDPYLDIELVSSVTERKRHQVVNSPIASEINDFSKYDGDTLKTIQVKANVKGLSSQIENNIQFSSYPQRSETEIIALLGGGFFDNFAEGDINGLGLANLASSAFLGSFQGELGEALGFSEFRLFPTQITTPNQQNSTLGLGAEIGIDIGDKLSLSMLKILTTEQAPQYSVKYRVNDQTVLRGSTDFENNTRGAVEFEHRF